MICQKATLSLWLSRPVYRVQARGRDTGTGTHGERRKQALMAFSVAVHVRSGGMYTGGTYIDLVSSVWPLMRRQNPIFPLPFASPGCFFQSYPVCLHYCILCTSNISNELELIQIKTFCFISFVQPNVNWHWHMHIQRMEETVSLGSLLRIKMTV